LTLAKRIVPCLDVKAGRVVKGVKFEGLRDAGDPVELSSRYRDEGADEVVFLDITASLEKRATLRSLVRNVAAEGKKSGITANIVLTSTIDTPQNRKAMPESDFTRWVTPQSIAKLIVWLASDAAADISGAVVPIYGRA